MEEPEAQTADITLLPFEQPADSLPIAFPAAEEAATMPEANGRVREPHINELDGVRGTAILMVFLFHYFPMQDGGGLGYRLAASTVKGLWCGVDLFFVLSGFLITGILLDTKSKSRYFLNFFARRALRIFPLYFAVAAIVFLLLPALFAVRSPDDLTLLRNQGWVWFYMVNVKVAMDGFSAFYGEHLYLHHLWSLAVEEHFYLVWPFVVYFGSTRFLRNVCMGCIAGALALRVGLLFTDVRPVAAYVFTLCRVDTLATGGLLSLVVREHVDLGGPRPIFRLTVAAAVGLVLLCGWRGGFNSEDAAVRTIGYTLLAFLFTGLLGTLLTLAKSHPVRGVFRFGALRTVGKYSYGLYVIHGLLIPAFQFHSVLTTRDLQHALAMPYFVAGMLRLALVFACCMALAVMSWIFIERYPLKLKRYFL